MPNSEIYLRLRHIHGRDIMVIQNVKGWCCQFEERREDIRDLPHEGRTCNFYTSDTIASMSLLLDEDKRLTICKIEKRIADELCAVISLSTIPLIISDKLQMKKKQILKTMLLWISRSVRLLLVHRSVVFKIFKLIFLFMYFY